MAKLIRKMRMRLGWFDLRKEGAKYVERHYGQEYVAEFLDKHEKINEGVPIGSMAETIVFLDLIKDIKRAFVEGEEVNG